MSRELVDPNTGEILTLSDGKLKPTFKVSIKGYYGEDCKPIGECTTADSLKHSISFIDDTSSFSKLEYDSQYVVDLVTTNTITPNEAKLLDLLVSRVVVWNYVFTTTKELSSVVSKSRRSLMSLEYKGLVKIDHTDKPIKCDRVIRINPVVCFKGSLWIRESKIKDWYSPDNITLFS